MGTNEILSTHNLLLRNLQYPPPVGKLQLSVGSLEFFQPTTPLFARTPSEKTHIHIVDNQVHEESRHDFFHTRKRLTK